jgi:8-amino-7-oxononanoate synthase
MPRTHRPIQLAKIEKFLAKLKAVGLYPDIPVLDGAATEPVVRLDGENFLLFSSNNILGMSSHPEVKEAARAAVDKYGLGSGGSRLMAANTDVHVQLEERIAEYLGRESAICFAAGYMANVGTIPALMKIDYFANLNLADMAVDFEKLRLDWEKSSPWDIFSEEKNHGSDVDGIRLSRSRTHIFDHKNMAMLEEQLAESQSDSKLIISDGVFSMDGDVAPIPKIVELSQQHRALVMIDDAHGIGVLGAKGCGSVEHFGVNSDDIAILMGTFTKAFGGVGGFVAGDRDLIDYLRISARTYIFSAPIAPAIAAGLIKAIDIVSREPWRREKALENAEFFRQEVQAVGFDTLGSETHIVPVLVGTEENAMRTTELLRARNIVAPNARFPAVPVGQARIRFVMTSEHTTDQIQHLLKCLKDIRVALNF